MISIVICHCNKDLLNRISKNIAATIGIEYELIIIDNTMNNHSIFSAYNEGVKRAKYEIVCFTHEDIIFFTKEWGKKLLAHYKNEEVGMIGVSGGTAQSFVPGAWWYNNYFSKSAINLLMSDTKKPGEALQIIYNNPFNCPEKAEVIIIDGLWFCIRKELFGKISFDEKTFNGFHLYDADISMQVGLFAKKYVVYDILLQHVWDGSISANYYKDLEKFAIKWCNYLPIQVKSLDNSYVHLLGWHTLRSLVLDMINKNIDKKNVSEIVDKYQPLLSKKYNSNWFNLYFILSHCFGYHFINSIFFRLEKIAGFAKNPGYIKKEYAENI